VIREQTNCLVCVGTRRPQRSATSDWRGAPRGAACKNFSEENLLVGESHPRHHLAHLKLALINRGGACYTPLFLFWTHK